MYDTNKQSNKQHYVRINILQYLLTYYNGVTARLTDGERKRANDLGACDQVNAEHVDNRLMRSAYRLSKTLIISINVLPSL